MTPRAFYKSHDLETVEKVAKKAGTSFANFQQIALYEGACSPKLARKLDKASGGAMPLADILFRKEIDDDRESAA